MEPYRKPWIEKDERTGHWFLRWRELGSDDKLHKRSLLCANFRDAVKRRTLKEKELIALVGVSKHSMAAVAPIYARYMIDMERIRQLRPSSLKAKRRALTPYVAQTERLGVILRDSLVAYRDSLFTTLAPTTVGIRMREIKAFVRWLNFEGLLAVNPFINIELPRQEPRPRFLTDAEIVQLERGCPERLRPILRVAYLTGARKSEILSAKWEDIHWVPTKNKAGELEIRAFWTIWAVTAKNRRSRTIFLKPSLVDLLGPRQESGRIFADWNVDSLRWAWDTLKKHVGLTGKVRFHDLRHTFCRIYLQGGGGLSDLREVTGHQSLKMMEIYAHFETRFRAERMEAMQLPAVLCEIERMSPASPRRPTLEVTPVG